LRNAGHVPVSPATVRDTLAEIVPGDVSQPAAEDVAEAGESVPPGPSVKRRLLIVAACVSAFVVGFAGVTVLMRDTGSASKPRPKTPQTAALPDAAGAPVAPQTSTKPPASAPPSSALVAEPGGGGLPAPSQPSSPTMPRPENAGPNPGPSPSTSVPAPTTSPPTTAPATTTP
jgi:hypothetical protein